MTASIVDDLTDTPSNKNRECIGQGIANTATGFIGGMAGCAMIGQSMINVKSGGRGRLSTFCAGMFLLFLIVVLGEWVKSIPMAALVAIMIMVSDRHVQLVVDQGPAHPSRAASSVVMMATVVWRPGNAQPGHRRADWRAAVRPVLRLEDRADFPRHLDPVRGRHGTELSGGGPVVLCLGRAASSGVRFPRGAGSGHIDVTRAHIWDISSVAALDMVVLKFRGKGRT